MLAKVSYLVPVIMAEGESAGGDITATVNTAISNAATEVKNMLTTNAPIILGVVVAFVVLAVGIKLVKNIRTSK